MQFRHEQSYDAPADRVHEMLADPDFRKRVCAAQKATACTVSIEPDGAGMSVTVDQKRPSDGIPGFARKIVGDEIRIVQREDWSDQNKAVLTVTIPGKPGELNGTITVVGDGNRTVETIDGDLRVSIPVLGAKLEQLIAELLGEALDVEQEIGRSWLAGER
ncbi:MAG TPA: DUF2505 domain-containing protein [Nocardioidaceae bacterium]|jgi:uncharacterized protein YndB with AHSA1/START domain|nr:DUF2505 domain-containing protein [Nocardioidaceae bacterium]